MNKVNRAAILILVWAVLLSWLRTTPVTAADTNNYCKVGSALKYTANQLKLAPIGSGYAGYRAALENVDILRKGELPGNGNDITRAEASLLASRVMDYLGEPEDTVQVERILTYGRISDIEKAPEKLRRAVARIYGTGILVGTSDGTYTQSRTFDPGGKLTAAGVRGVIKKAMGKQERKPMSPDGQLIRTTNLPVNACEYDYILAGFPNSFYQLKFGYELSSFDSMPVSPKDYAAPADVKNRNAGTMIEEWKYEWAELIRKNYKLKLNFDYRTTDVQTWIKELAATYNVRFDQERNAEQIRKITDWARWAKKNKVIIESRIVSVEPSTFHYSSGLQVNCYVKFRIKSCTDFEKNKEKVIFTGDDWCRIEDVKLNQWYGDIIVNSVSWYTLTPEGETAGVRSNDAFCPLGSNKDTLLKKTGLMQPVKFSERSYGFEYIK